MAAFLLLKDSRSSFEIEGEAPPRDRIQRRGRVIGEAGHRPIDHVELERLQRIVLGDARFVHLGLHAEDGFVGVHDRVNGAPIPGNISARHEDLAALIDGLTASGRDAARHLDPVLAAAALAFGFVYIHPFEACSILILFIKELDYNTFTAFHLERVIIVVSGFSAAGAAVFLGKTETTWRPLI